MRCQEGSITQLDRKVEPIFGPSQCCDPLMLALGTQSGSITQLDRKEEPTLHQEEGLLILDESESIG